MKIKEYNGQNTESNNQYWSMLVDVERYITEDKKSEKSKNNIFKNN